MTTEEAIKTITQMLDEFHNEDSYAPECKDAVDMAIEALKAQSKHDQNTPQKRDELNTLGIKTGETCEDVISRRDAIDGVKTLHDVAWKNWHEPTLSANVVLNMIRELPSVQPERKKGLWKVIRYNGDMQRYARCKCGYEYGAGKFDGLKFVALKLHNFCPNCGAKMEVEECHDKDKSLLQSPITT